MHKAPCCKQLVFTTHAPLRAVTLSGDSLYVFHQIHASPSARDGFSKTYASFLVLAALSNQQLMFTRYPLSRAVRHPVGRLSICSAHDTNTTLCKGYAFRDLCFSLGVCSTWQSVACLCEARSAEDRRPVRRLLACSTPDASTLFRSDCDF